MRRTRISFGQLAMRLSGVTASDIIRKRIAQSPVWWIASVIGRAPSGPSGTAAANAPENAAHESHSAGRQAPTSTMAFSGENFPDRSVQGVMRRFRLMPRYTVDRPNLLQTPHHIKVSAWTKGWPPEGVNRAT